MIPFRFETLEHVSLADLLNPPIEPTPYEQVRGRLMRLTWEKPTALSERRCIAIEEVGSPRTIDGVRRRLP